MFAMNHKDGTFVSGNAFLTQGLRIMRKEREMQREWDAERDEQAATMEAECEESHDISLLEGKLKREELKNELFTYLNNVE